MTGSAMTGPPTSERWSSWQALDSGRLLLMSTTAMLVLAAFATATINVHVVERKVALAFGGFIALGELLRLALPGGREAAPIAMVGGMSYALLLIVPGATGLPPHAAPTMHPRSASALTVIAVAAIGMMVGSLPHIAAGLAGLTGMCTRLVAIACVAFAFRPAGVQLPGAAQLVAARPRRDDAAGPARLAGRHDRRRADPRRRRRRAVLGGGRR